MPFADNKGVKIHYEVEGEGDAIVLMHGFGSDLNGWRLYGYVDVLGDAYQCILVDARGHGHSDKPKDVSSCGFDVSYQDVIAVLDDLRIDQAIYWGYSMGGVIGLVAANAGDGRFSAVVIGGAAPGPRSETSVQNSTGTLRLLEQGKEAFLAVRPPAARALYKDIDTEALATVMRALLEKAVEPDLVAPPMPCLVYNGGSDLTFAAAEAASARALQSVRFEQIGDLNHLQCYQRSDLVLPVVLSFLQGVTKGGAIS